MMTTRLRTGDGLDVVVPNSAVVSATIRNYSSQPVRRIELVVRIGYGDDIRRASEVLLGMLVDDERVLADPPPKVTVAELEPSCVRLNVRPWVNNEDYGSTKSDLSARTVAVLREHEIAVAYPQMGVHIEQAS
jgi:small conductance mechanosensitive channel